MDFNIKKYEAANNALPEYTENRVVFLGDSITEFWLVADKSFFENKPYINRGISGQTTSQMIGRFQSDVINLRPKVVVILAGINDIAQNTGPIAPEETFTNIVAMAEKATQNGIRIVLSSILPAHDFTWRLGLEPADKIIHLNMLIRDYANKNNIPYIDYHSAMKDQRNGLDPNYTNDGVHLTKLGYKVMAPLAEKAIAQVLAQKTTPE